MLKARSKKDVRDMAGNRYAEGSLHDVVFARYPPLSKDEWEPALTGEDPDRLLGGDGDKEPGRP